MHVCSSVKIFGHDFWGADIQSNSSHKSYRPLTTFSFRLSRYATRHFFGWTDDQAPESVATFIFHAENLLLHCLATALVYALSLKICSRLCSVCAHRQLTVTTQTRDGRQTAHDCALISSLLFGVHPVHVEAVTGIVGRAELLCAVFVFSAFWLWSVVTEHGPLLLLFCRGRSQGQYRASSLLGLSALVLVGVGALAKETVGPIAHFIFDVWTGHRCCRPHVCR